MKDNLEYNHKKIENKWKEIWYKDNLYSTDSNSLKPKFYILDMFPYPSGVGLHVGHLKGYTATDIVARYMRMKDFEVLHPMGWDSFGLPTENFAIKTNKNPFDVTKENTRAFKQELINAGIGIDWNREFDTSDESYYKWTQWIFLKLYNKGLAYKKKSPVNWCPSCLTVISNEQVIQGLCERCGSKVELKNIEQWFFKITKYIDNLMNDIKSLDWPKSTKVSQDNWIGKSEGVRVKFRIKDSKEYIDIFTTKIETIYGTTFIAIAPESKYIELIKDKEKIKEIEEYIKNVSPQSEITRKKDVKTGLKTGLIAINPINGQEIPVYISDYILMEYGTGAVMGVPAHDNRDKAFAKLHGIKSIEVVNYKKGIINHGKYNGISIDIAKNKIISDLSSMAEKTIEYKLRDWLVSRERYWGAPIPIIYCKECGEVPVPETDLPILIPRDIKDYRPKGTPPLASSKSFMEVECPICHEPATREPKTLDTFVDSSWYYLRFIDPKNNRSIGNNTLLRKWLPIDFYMGGDEHATGHLLYSRFITKVLNEEGIVSINEPFLKLRHQGKLFGPDGRKMSKRWGNVVSAEFAEKTYGADSLRMYEMFMGPLSQSNSWDTRSMIGVRRFIDRVWKLQNILDKNTLNKNIDTKNINNLIKSISLNIESEKYNVCVSEFMKYLNEVEKLDTISKDSFRKFILVLAPFAPFIAEELWNIIGEKYSVHKQSWPTIIKVKEDKNDMYINLPIQINGKYRGNIKVLKDQEENEIIKILLKDTRFQDKIKEKDIRKVIFKKNIIINIIFDDI